MERYDILWRARSAMICMIGFVHTADSAMIAMYLVMLICFYLVEQYVYLMVFTDFAGLWRLR